MHEHKWTTAPHDGWNVEKVIIDYANEQIKQVWEKEHDHQTDDVNQTDDQPPHEDDEQHEAPPIESEKQKGTAMKRPAAFMKVKAANKVIKETAKKVIKVKAAKKVIKVKKAKAAKKVIKKTAKKVIKVKAAKNVIKVKKAKAAKKVIKKTAKNVIKKTVKKAKAAAPM